MTEPSLQRKVALVTGSSRGVGAGIAAALAEAGATTVVHHRDSLDQARSVAKNIETAGGRALVFQGDLTQEEQVLRLFRDVRDQVGPVDILGNNAGTSQPRDIFRITMEDWNRILHVNLTSAFACTRAVVEDMKERRWGRIIYISSVVARQGALFGHAHYAATKSGMIGMAKSVARTMAPYQVTVNTLCVGMVETELLHQTLDEEQIREAVGRIPLGRFCHPREVGYACAFLAGEQAGYITGAAIDINGGMVMDG